MANDLQPWRVADRLSRIAQATHQRSVRAPISDPPIRHKRPSSRQLFSAMRILHVIPSISSVRGGPSETIRTLAHGLARAGVHVEVATTDDDGGGRLGCGSSERFIEGAIVHCFPRQSRLYTCSWPLTSWLARHTREFELVHIHA